MTHCLNCANWRRSDDALIGWCNAYDGWRFQFEGMTLAKVGKQKVALDCRKFEAGEERETGLDYGLSYRELESLRLEVDRVYEKMRYDHKKEMPYWKKKQLERKRMAMEAK